MVQHYMPRRSEKGLTLIETTLAIGLMAVGLMGLAALVPMATQRDFELRTDTTATFIAEQQLEAMLAQPFAAASFTGAADGAGDFATINLTCGTPPCAQGAQLTAQGLVDFGGQAYSDVPVNYRRLYAIAPDPAEPKVNQGLYEVRWNIAQNSSGLRTIVIAVRPSGEAGLAVPMTLRAARMR
jgi:hypothetical protein